MVMAVLEDLSAPHDSDVAAQAANTARASGWIFGRNECDFIEQVSY
jgi:hypothetical protein